MESTLDSAKQTKKKDKFIYKSMKDVPKDNPCADQCNFFIATKMRFCKFQRMKDQTFCQHHNTDLMVSCEKCGHSMLKETLEKQHSIVCKAVKEKEQLESMPWYSKQSNLLRDTSDINIELEDIHYDELITKIKEAYLKIAEEYTQYLESTFKDFDISTLKVKGYTASGLSIKDSDLNQTLQLSKLEKHGSQGLALINVMKEFGLINDEYVYIEFGAGKGGLSEKVIEATKDKANYVLLEREGVRFKKDKCSKNCKRFRTDILDFDINYLSTVYKDKNPVSIVGIAKHICGCALDMSISTLLNFKEGFKGICFASCCHQICANNHFVGYDKLKRDYKFTDKELAALYRTTSWLFEKNESAVHEKFEKHFTSIKEKKRVGIISKYIIDLSRVFYLISKGKTALYLKYCSNEITTENNVIICF